MSSWVWLENAAPVLLRGVSGSCPVMPDSLQPHGLWPARLLCPWGSPGKNTGVGCHALLQGIFLTQGSDPPLLLSLALAVRFFITSVTWEVHMYMYLCVCMPTHAPNVKKHDSLILSKDS